MNSLSKNHRRAVGSAILIIEKKLDELEYVLFQRRPSCCIEVEGDISEDKVEDIKRVIDLLKSKISEVHERYELRKETITLQQILQSTQAKIWEVLHNSKPKNLSGYGDFGDSENASALEKDIDELLELNEKLRVMH